MTTLRVLLFSLLWFQFIHAQDELPVAEVVVERELEEAETSPIPESLQDWIEWVQWGKDLNNAPPFFDNAGQRIAIWPSDRSIEADGSRMSFEVSVSVFAPAWINLPGNGELWPQNVKVDSQAAVVVERNNLPATRLEPGVRRITGEIPWQSMPQRIPIPGSIGVLNLTVNGEKVDLPNWGADGFLWLKRNRTEDEAEREYLETKIYRMLEDGIPMWLHTEIDLRVAGKSREEDLGFALPEGWKVATVESRIPCAVDDSGRVRVQARAGKWTIMIKAFRNDSITEVAFAEDRPPMVEEEIIGFRAKPSFRLVEVLGIQAIDVSQTTYPDRWRDLPVFQWDTSQSFQLEEKMRGMGFQKTSGLNVQREFWLDDEGDLLTFRDFISGNAQQSWRLDVSPGQELGAARIAGEGQLITKNPITGASGLEIRERSFRVEAVGRIPNARQFPASGWQEDVDSCEATLHLPPGWRVLAMFGTEWVRGDWLTTWTLLDLFLLLVFTMAVWRLWGWLPAIVALIGFGLTFHEPGAPKYTWFLLLIPLAILKVGVTGRARVLAELAKYLAFAILLVFLVPFVGRQLQGVVYPQLETEGLYRRSMPLGIRSSSSNDRNLRAAQQDALSYDVQKKSPKAGKELNLKQDLQARIQTGPAVPEWKWREVKFGWRGPVTPTENVRAILIPPSVQRLITLARVILLILLVAVLMQVRRILPPFLRNRPVKKAATAAILAFSVFFTGAGAQEAFPPDHLLKELEKRLNETPDAFPRAAEIPKLDLTVGKSSINMKAEIHLGARAAVPLPGKLPDWSPVSILIDGQPAESVARIKDHLWVVLDKGIHDVVVGGLLPNNSEWEWTSLLKPRRVSIDAPNWTVTGIKPNGIVEDQVLFALKTPAVSREAAYDRKDFVPAMVVERELEIGLVWQVRSSLVRLTPKGKALAFSIPLLPGERVLSSNFTVTDGKIDVRMGANSDKVSWESELPLTETLDLNSSPDNPWVERWKVIASPVWNVQFSGLPPVYESGAGDLRPVWTPWPGENVSLTFSRPEAIPGATLTVRKVSHFTSVGSRQRVSKLNLDLQASLGQEFTLDLPPESEVSKLVIKDERNPKGSQQPVRRDADGVIIPVRPGEQQIELEWRRLKPIGTTESVDQLELPVESSNIDTHLGLPPSRWVLWTFGPLRGPAVRLWGILLLTVIGALILGRLSSSPLRGSEWGLLAIGLSQVHPIAILLVVCWFFLIAFRGSDRGAGLKPLPFNLIQIILVLLAVPVAVIILAALHRGLLGTPDMMVLGNSSSSTNLRWFAQRAESVLPEAGVISVSIWFYRLLMLAWALWLAISALRWARWGWQQYSRQSLWKNSPPKVVSSEDKNQSGPPPLK